MMIKNGILGHTTFTGKEKDEETGYGYFGARYMDYELMTMWLSVDPMADKYPSISPYAYCAWNPVKLIDPDGREVVLPSNIKWAQKIVDDLNRIYNAVYHTKSNAFVLQQRKDSKGNTYYRLGANKDFDWNQDKYTKAMKQCIDDPVKVTIIIVKNHNPDGPTNSLGRKIDDFIEDLGGGKMQGRTMYISEDLPTFSEENKTRGKFAKKHCLGGIVLHELLYHCHTVGRTDEKESPLEGPKVMQTYYSLKRSQSHGTGDNQVFPSNQRR